MLLIFAFSCKNQPITKINDLLSTDIPSENIRILTFGYEKNILDKTVDKETFTTVFLPPTSPLESQASIILGQAEKIIRKCNSNLHDNSNVWLFVNESFPTGLYESLMNEFDPFVEPRWNLATPKIFVHGKGDGALGNYSHKNRNMTVSAHDREFCFHLLDSDERKDLEHALLDQGSVLITGDAGTGKTLLARYIHYHCMETATSGFVETNFAGIPENYVESELRGVESNAFSGVAARKGLLEEAHKGTLFLDEIGIVDKSIQAKLLRIISENILPVEYRRVGSTEIRCAEVRFIAATNLPHNELIKCMRKDLRSRFPIKVRLKKIGDKKPDPLQFYLHAVNHFSSLSMAFNPTIAPEWEVKLVKEMFEEKKLPDNLRDLHSMVKHIFRQRKLLEEPLHSSIRREEIMQACQAKQSDEFEIMEESLVEADVSSLIKYLSVIEASQGIRHLADLSVSDSQELIYRVKRLALNIALWHPIGSTTKGAMQLYGMSNPTSFQEYKERPAKKLHPNKNR